MQQRRLSAHIVTNPRTSKRKEGPASGDLSLGQCHWNLSVPSQISSKYKHKRHKVCTSPDDPNQFRNVSGKPLCRPKCLIEFADQVRDSFRHAAATPHLQAGYKAFTLLKDAPSKKLPKKYHYPPLQETSDKIVSKSHVRPSAALPSANLPSGHENQKLLTPTSVTGQEICLPPTLLKEPAYTFSYAESLVEVATTVTYTLWACSDLRGPNLGLAQLSFKDLSDFITETVSRSRTSLSTMQLALLYCIQSRRDQDNARFRLSLISPGPPQSRGGVALHAGLDCPRRNFLTALILASKYLQDKNFSNKAWAKISSINLCEINSRERDFLDARHWNLHVEHKTFQKWSQAMEAAVSEVRDTMVFGDLQPFYTKWAGFVRDTVRLPGSDLSEVVVRLSSYSASDRSHSVAVSAAMSSWVKSAKVIGAMSESPESPEVFRTADSTPAISSLIRLGDLSSPELCDREATSCPFFDEFIRSTPRESDVQDGDQWQVPTMTAQVPQYLTPQSMRTTSPESLSSEYGCSRETLKLSSSKSGTPKDAQRGSPISFPPSKEILSAHTPLIRPYPSFDAFAGRFFEQQQSCTKVRGLSDWRIVREAWLISPAH